MKANSLIFFYISYFVNYSFCLIIIPLSISNYKVNSSYDKISELYTNEICINFKLGFPPQSISIPINLNCEAFSISENFFNYNKSKTFMIDLKKRYYSKNNFQYSYLSNDTFNSLSIYDVIENKFNHIDKKLYFLLGKGKIEEEGEEESISPGCVDLKIIKNDYQNLPLFLKELKRNELIKNNYWTLKFDKIKNQEELLIGEEPNYLINYIFNSSNYFKEGNYLQVKYFTDGSGVFLGMNFKEIFYFDSSKNKILMEKSVAHINMFIDLIFGNEEYRKSIEENFFNYYITKNLCQKKKMFIDEFYIYYVCKHEKNFKLKQFPPIYFNHFELNYTFSLNYEDLFFLNEKDNLWYFKIIFYKYETFHWIFGTTFFKKYNFIFNPEHKEIGFYNNQNNSNNENESFWKKNLFKVIIIIFLLVIFISGIIYEIELFKNRRKPRKNEIKDSYEYNTEDNLIN